MVTYDKLLWKLRDWDVWWGSWGWQVNSVVAWTWISVNSTDPANPVVNAAWDIKVNYFGIKASDISAPSLIPNGINNTITSTTGNWYISVLFYVDRNWFDSTVTASFTDTDALWVTSWTFYNNATSSTSIIGWTGQISGLTTADNDTYDLTFTFTYGSNTVVIVVPFVLNIGTFTSSFNETINISWSYDLNDVITKNSPWTWPFTYSINTAPTGTSISTNTLTTWASTGSLIVNIVDVDGRTSTATTTVDAWWVTIEIRWDFSNIWWFWTPLSVSDLSWSTTWNLLLSFTFDSSDLWGSVWRLWYYNWWTLPSQTITWSWTASWPYPNFANWTVSYNWSDTIITLIDFTYPD